MSIKIDETGNRYGRLLVLKRSNKESLSGNIYYECLCNCGNKYTTLGSSLRIGKTTSCGCLTSEKLTKHGGKHEYLYRKYYSIKQRCYNENYRQYDDYGGRGITVCKEWLESYVCFREYVSKLRNCPNASNSRYTFERINNNGNYEPGNVKWALRKDQARNRRITLFIKYHGIEVPFAEFVEIKGVTYNMAYYRYKERIYQKEIEV